MMGEFFKGFGINWKLLTAQLVNFALLFLIFKKWIFRPIFQVLERRKEMIRESLQKAKEIDKKLAKIEELKKEEMRKTRLEMEEILRDAKKRGENLQKEIILDAQRRAGKILAEAKTKIELEKEKMKEDLKKEFASLLILSLEKILKREYGKEDEKRILRVIQEEIKK